MQWWYGHNAVASSSPRRSSGIMYYFLPKAAERPVYSYRLSIIHFWALVFLYIWAGPHHLLNTALPDWAQTLGMVFSSCCWAPSWGGMLNGLLTLRGAWDKLRTDPVLKFFAAGVTFYGMATFEGPLLSISAVNALAHYTDWIIGHVHGGALGWNGMIARHVLLAGARGSGTGRCTRARRGRPRTSGSGPRHPALRRLDVGRRDHPGPDVARARRRRASSYPNFVEIVDQLAPVLLDAPRRRHRCTSSARS